MAASKFLRSPGRAGAFGALMDEYARAAEDFCATVDRFSPAEWEEQRPSDDPDCRSAAAIVAHACGSAWGYANTIRGARGLATSPKPDLAGLTPAGVRGRLADALRYSEEAVDGLRAETEAEYAAMRALEVQVRWGPRYDPEMLLEHAICHLLRHRRQLERWKASARP